MINEDMLHSMNIVVLQQIHNNKIHNVYLVRNVSSVVVVVDDDENVVVERVMLEVFPWFSTMNHDNLENVMKK